MNDYDDNENNNRETGLVDELPVLSIDVPDRDLINNFKRWEKESQAFWDDRNGYNLTERRKRNKRYYLGRQIEKDKLYNYQVPFVDNELFVATETITAYTTSQDPSAEVLPENDTTQSKVMAEDLEWALNVHSQKHELATKIEHVERAMFMKYVGVLKLYWDDEIQDVVPRAIDPEKIIFDKSCKQGDNPLFICELCSATLQQIINMFPDKENEIMAKCDRVRKTPKLMNSIYNYKEVWFTQIDENGETECVAWYMDDLLLGKSKNPNYLYDEDGVQVTNFLPRAQKPYILFNYMNDGSHVIDQTSPFEQAIPLQDILNKRGRQIVENADTANAILVLKSNAITSDEAENITRDPNQILLLQTDEGQPINSAFGSIEPHLLPNYVLNDKQDVKNAIHEIMGTPAQFRGSTDSQQSTLGETQIVTSQASGRQDAIIRALERGLDRYYKLLVQMFKVWYDKPHNFACRDNDGKFVSVELTRERIPDVAYVTVEHGTTMKQDKYRQENIAMTLARLGLIDPYNLFKDLGMKNADQRYETLVKFKMSPDSLSEDIRQENQNRMAYIDFACIMNGEDVKGHDDVDAEHILAHRAQITTDKFLYAPRQRQEKMLAHIQEEVQLLSTRVKLQEASMQGLLVDPNIPVTPNVPEAPQQPQMPPMAGGMPPMGGQQPMPTGDQLMAQGGLPMPQMSGGMPMDVQNAIPPVEQMAQPGGDLGALMSIQ